MRRRAAILTLGRERGLGELRRVESWEAILTSADLVCSIIPLRAQCAPGPRARPAPGAVLSGRAPIETLSWSPTEAVRRLAEIEPDITIFITLRAFHPRLLLSAGRPVLDLVDRLSVSYSDRASLAQRRSTALMFKLLGKAMLRVEHHLPDVTLVAAGRGDAHELGASWIPNVVGIPDGAVDEPDHDIVFFGNLAYPPNVAAVLRLRAWWPELERVRPGTTLLVAGRNPDPRVRDAVAAMGATLETDYLDPTTVARRGRLAVAPLEHTAGIQNKVLEAAAAGVAQIISTGALAGLPEGFPARRADDGVEFAQEVSTLLNDATVRAQLGDAARHAAERFFAPMTFRPWILEQMA